MNLHTGQETISQTTIAERVKAMIAESLGLHEYRVVDSASLRDDLGADSLDLVQLARDAEQKFSIYLTDEQMQGLDTVADVVWMVELEGKK